MRALRNIGITVAIAILGFFAIGIFAASSPEGHARSREREVIRNCWDEQGRKSLSPGMQRSVALVCERLEAEYRAKWNREP